MQKLKWILSRIPIFFQAYWRKLVSKPNYIEDIVRHRTELVKLKSPECLKIGNCKHCGCDTTDLMYSDPSCEGDCYPKIER